VRLQAVYDVARLRSVAPGLFWPRPKVESALLRFELREERPSGAALARLDRLTAVLFEQRRKTLAKRLEAYFGDRARAEAACAELGIDPGARPETLENRAFLALAELP
jgi:16S rRNA (adenine1518-N6/adenine1519-N6)-dimethyltransferase